MPRRGGLGTLGSGKGRRRTVLQLGETPRDPTFGFGYQPIVEPDNSRVEPPISKPVNALGGLLSHYGESESEEEEEPEERRPKSILRVGGYDTSAHRSKSKSGDNYKKMKFVAATRSISTPTEDLSPAPPPAQATPEPDRNGQDKPEVKDEIDAKVFDFLAEINADEEPQVNGDTGDKTTDDEKEPDIAAKEVTGDLASDARKEESDSDSEEELTEPIEPTTVWQHCLDDGTQHYYYWNIETNVVTWEIPPDYSQYLLLLKEYEEKLSKYQSELEVRKNKPKKKDKGTSKKSDSESTVEAPTKEPENEADTSVSSSTVSLVPYEETPEVVKTKPRVEIGPQLPPNFVSAEADAPSVEQKAEKEETLPQESEIEWQSDEIGDSNSAAILKEEVVVDKKTDASAKDDLEKASKIMETLEKEFARRCDAPEEVPVEEDAAAAETEVQEEDDDFDFDDIDQQLDMALERKLKSNADTEKEKSENVSRPEKRSLVNYSEDDPEIEAKKQKKEHDFGGDVDKDDADYSEYSATTDEVNDLSQLVADKLEFLDVSSKNLTKLQIILIETETRLSDWREGALASDFMLVKLKEANLRLEQYESTAAPPGWSCHFDRSYKRYFYCHHVTGETQWDYPEGAGAEGEASDTLQADLRDVAKHPPPPPPTEEPQPRAKELPEPDDIMMSGFAPGSPVKITEQEAPENTSPEPMASPDVEQNPSIAADLADDIKLCAKPPPPPDEPPPPGTEPPLPPESTYSLVSLAAAPPPPPPPEEPTSSTSVYDVTARAAHVAEVYHTYEHEMETDTTQPDNDSAHISAPPVINRTSVQLKESVERNNSDEHHVSKPAVALTVDSTPVTEQAPVESAAPAAPAPTHTPSSKKKKKDKDKEKALVAGGLNLKKKKLPSLVQKWQQVQKEVD